MASSVVAALPSAASRLSISRRLRAKARRALKSGRSSIFLSSAALATIFMSIRNASTFSFLVAGSICARLGPSSSSASATSLWRISAPFTLASTGLASSARSGRLANRAIASTLAAAAKRTCAPRFASDDEVVMENPYVESRMAVAAGPFSFVVMISVGKPVSTFPDHALKPRDTRPIARPWQREKSVKMMKLPKGGPDQAPWSARDRRRKRPDSPMVNARSERP